MAAFFKRLLILAITLCPVVHGRIPDITDEEIKKLLGWDYHVSMDRFGEPDCSGDQVGDETRLQRFECHSWDEPFRGFRYYVRA